ncbi:BRCA2 and CDKN1A-interacting protein-like [Strongylocentrotus purpuratus]|uniref:Protein BCCIP homolog n=1 Tax=Strongylocentrotus purpuratus TaxID=7668 RepID=A0A7M7NVU7_STRPU|nr:BRCA2 and CDKN1A-interacting protein-like [Strongylocentrotus purpuratus]
MATYSKKKRVDLEEKESDSSDDNDEMENDDIGDDKDEDCDSSDEEINEEVQIEFEAFPPQDNDFHGIKRLLQHLFSKTKVNTSQLTDLILSQNHVGCVLKQSDAQLAEESDSDDNDDDDVFGFTTVLNIIEKKNTECIQEIHKLIVDKCSACNSVEQVDELSRILGDESHNVGLLLCERFVNIPHQLAPPLHSSLQSDIRRAGAKNPHLKFDYYLLMSRAYQQPKPPSKKKKTPDIDSIDWIFTNAEDEIFLKESVLNLHYPSQMDQAGAVGGKWSEDDAEMKTFRVVMVVPASKMNNILTEIQEVFAV